MSRRSVIPKRTVEQLAEHRRRFPPLPPRRAELVYAIDDEIVAVSLPFSAAKLEQLRSLFPGKTDGEISNGLADELLARFGIQVTQ